MGFPRTCSRASGSLATFTSPTILPVSSTMQVLVSLTETSSPAKWSMLRSTAKEGAAALKGFLLDLGIELSTHQNDDRGNPHPHHHADRGAFQINDTATTGDERPL